MWKNGPVNAAAVTIPALFKTSRLFIVASVCYLQKLRVGGIEEKLDGLFPAMAALRLFWS
jgi:hypothetical protein